MLRIGIISDTHGTLDPRAYAALADCEHIIHAGDIGGVAILRELETLAPVTAVLGNNDFDEYGSAVGHFAHPVLRRRALFGGPQAGRRAPSASPARRALAPGDPLPDVIVHGHTHVPELKTGQPTRAPRASTYAPAPCIAPAASSAAPSQRWTWKPAPICAPG